MSTPPLGPPANPKGARDVGRLQRRSPRSPGAIPSSTTAPLPSRPKIPFHGQPSSPRIPNESSTRAGNESPREDSRAKQNTSENAKRVDNSAEEIARLREAVNARISLNNRERLARQNKSHSTHTSAPSTDLHGASPSTDEFLAAGYASLEAAFISPPPTGSRTTSTESNATVRGGEIGGTPDPSRVLTPSYPFPYVPAAQPRLPTTPFHRPFTALSPTGLPPWLGSSRPDEMGEHPTVPSGPATPRSTMTFLPPSISGFSGGTEHPSPSLYELTLALTSEPGLDTWWSNVVQILRENYCAERVSLAVPADTTDPENIPWGQKATFNAVEEDKFSLAYLAQSHQDAASEEEDPDAVVAPSSGESVAPAEHLEWSMASLLGHRPRLASRHSFSGFEARKKRSSLGAAQVPEVKQPRPAASRTKSVYTSDQFSQHSRLAVPLSSSQLNTESLKKHAAMEASGEAKDAPIGEPAQREARGRMFPVLQALDFEAQPLLDPGGVHRVLEKSDVVVLSREYNAHTFESENVNIDQGERFQPAAHSEDLHHERLTSTSGKTGHVPATGEKSQGAFQKDLAGARPNSDELENTLHLPRNERGPSEPSSYEEFEQTPASPWAQSPAPSPAIRSDTNENPFFAAATVDESSFSPNPVSQDYTTGKQVEAIGVDHATTIVHVPLYHPLLSKSVQPARFESNSAFMANTDAGLGVYGHSIPESVKTGSGHKFHDKKIPIAILSILSSVIPYPSNLSQSLSLLGPHLATSFSLARHYTTVESEASGLARRRYGSSSALGFGAVIDQGRPLDDLASLEHALQLGSEEGPTGSITGSITSPSEYSGVSKSSPPGSLGGTPTGEAHAHPYPSDRRSIGGTPGRPGTLEPNDSYFVSKKPGHLSRSNSGVVPTLPVMSLSSTKQTSNAPESQWKRRSGDNRGVQRDVTSPTEEDIDRIVPEEDQEIGTMEYELSLAKRGSGQRSERTRRKTEISISGSSAGSQWEGRLSARASDPSASQRKQAPWFGHAQGLRKGERPHTLLHSYGADFGATYQSLPSATSVGSRPSVVRAHTRTASGSLTTPESNMPPPSERLLRTIIDSIPVQIFTAAPRTGALTWVNSKFLTYRGLTVAQFSEDPWQSIHPEECEDYLKSWVQALRSSQGFSRQVRIRRFDGQYRWFFVRAAPLRDTRGVTVHWCGTFMDIHDQHVAEVSAARQKETAQSEAKYRSLANSSPQIVFAATREEGITFANTQWLSYSGQHFEDALGLGFTEYVHPDDLVKCRLPQFSDPTSTEPSARPSPGGGDIAASPTPTTQIGGSKKVDISSTDFSELTRSGVIKVSKDSNGKPSYSTEIRLRNNDGEYRWHLVRCLAVDSINFGNGEGSWFGTCTDINDHKLLEQKLKETMDSKTRFLSNMSHEIRTPLNGISGMVNFLLDTPLTEEQMDSVNIVRTSCENLGYLINDILDLSKVEAGMVKLSFQPFYVRSVIEEVNDLISALAIKKRLELNYIVDDDVPALVMGDRIRIRQVLLNIIGNAIKFTSRGEVFLRCQVYRSQQSAIRHQEIMLQFDVDDTGSGFTEAEAELLFKPFSQIDGSSTRQHGGSGLGLVISRQLVELHGGQMNATSVPGKGSTFTFFVKFQLPPEESRPEGQRKSQNVSETPNIESTKSGQAKDSSAVGEQEIIRPLLAKTYTQSPGNPGVPGTESIQSSPAVLSSGSSAPSVGSLRTFQSDRSSMSSILPSNLQGGEDAGKMNLKLPSVGRLSPSDSRPATSRGGSPMRPPMYSVLVVCALEHSREATMRHLEKTLPEDIPHQITTRSSLPECQRMIGGNDPVVFTHIVINLSEADEVIAFMDQIFHSDLHPRTSVIIASDSVQKREIIDRAPHLDMDKLVKQLRVLFVFKPLKPSKFADIFDPNKVRQLSTDRNRDSAQQVAESQRQVFANMENVIGNRGHRILLVEDNEVNQLVLQKFFRRISVVVETVSDGAQCIERVFSQPHAFYSAIICDLHMPNKDGYETCREIRQWEDKQHFSEHDLIPIIALSANVMADVVDKCIEAGFNNYVSKPVNFGELSKVLMDLLNPARPRQLMRHNSHPI
ncbi:hypothetical protein L228DRAFT_244028 [Xylona heveae TC161]|uniref:Histidine kinase HHK2p n=1 Tax=Xylona heveae (strain CBS 132557 / TC161) TaxID=1328760 RepID=A0A165IQF5_XYLHT|nr:hypothetical protein L228DRAFT_244028 [Xylona heveae TC161]KZF25234.1 hypothetical protein L228DRAFT_244028 [Xylona heveae TC161]